MQLKLSEYEIEIIKIWADCTIRGGHWGNGDLTIPEESIVLHKLEGVSDGNIDLTSDEAKIILTWSESSQGIHIMEEESALRKLRSVIDVGNR